MIDTGEPEVITTEPIVSQPGQDEPGPGTPGADQPPFETYETEPPSIQPLPGDERQTGRKVLPPLGGSKLIDKGLLRAPPAPGALGVDGPTAGAGRAETPSADPSARNEEQQRNGRKVLPPLGGAKLIDKSLLRPSPGP